jgi:hypothetical protein
MNETLKPLPGHTTPETAYIVPDYPYGFRLRCKIRYWLEYRPGKGFRLGSQTTNPKLNYEYWNKAKHSTYHDLGVMGLNAENHVTWVGCHAYNTETWNEFITTYSDSFDENQKRVATAMKKALDAYNARKVL